MGSSFASVFPRGSVSDNTFLPVEEEKEEEKQMDIERFIKQMKDMTDHEKKVTENFLKSIYSKNEEEFGKFISNEAKSVNYNQFFRTTIGELLMTSLAF